MSIESVQIIDLDQNIVATARVEYNGEYYSGFINLDLMPEILLSQFREFELLVSQQVFSLLDEIYEQTKGSLFTVAFADGKNFALEEMHIYPNEGIVSFWLEQSETQ
jgi:hypothetical protein